ncbi:MAG TPA: hypothetical protein ENH82_16580 [bacterium]|nr:hypothetical protein [bacterium]
MVRFDGTDVLVKPAAVVAGNFYYIKVPTDFVYAVTYDSDGRGYAFDEGSSTDTEFGENAIDDIVSRALKYLGVSKQNKGAFELGMVNDNDNT